MHSGRRGETLLPKRIALPVFCSDPPSSNAYATEEIRLMLSVGGLGLFHLVPRIATAVAMLHQANQLRVYVAQLRRELERQPSRPQHLLTEASFGYRFAP